MLRKWIPRSLIFAGILVFLFPILVIAGWIISAYWSNTHPEIGVNVEQVDWLPSSASNISYFKMYSYTAYEFNITEEDFISWVGDKELAEISDPVSIERFNFPETFFRTEHNTAEIANGLWWETPPRGNGGRTQIAFDRDIETAYYQDNPR